MAIGSGVDNVLLHPLCVWYCVVMCVRALTICSYSIWMCVCVCVCCGGDFGCVFLAVGVGSVEVRLLLKNVLLEKDKEKVSFSGHLHKSRTANFPHQSTKTWNVPSPQQEGKYCHKHSSMNWKRNIFLQWRQCTKTKYELSCEIWKYVSVVCTSEGHTIKQSDTRTWATCRQYFKVIFFVIPFKARKNTVFLTG